MTSVGLDHHAPFATPNVILWCAPLESASLAAAQLWRTGGSVVRDPTDGLRCSWAPAYWGLEALSGRE